MPIVVTTADLTEGVRDMCSQAGADGFLRKPISMDDLLDTVATVFAASGTAVLI